MTPVTESPGGVDRQPSLAMVVADLETFITKGAGFWRGFQLDLKVVPTLGIVSEREVADDGPDAENEAIEAALEEAINALHKPNREAAAHLFGFSEAGRLERGKTRRGELAAKEVYTNHRSFRRKGSRSRSKEEDLVEAVAKSLLRLEQGRLEGAGGGRPPRLLYVEDTPSWVTVAREALPDYEVVCADTLGKAMKALVSEGPFALVLVDPNLTDLDEGAGLEVLEYLRDHMPQVPRVVVTGSRFPGAITTTLGKRYGVSEILIKGDYTLPDLRGTIDRLVRKRPSEDETGNKRRNR